MNHIRLKVFKNKSDFLSCLTWIYSFNWISQFRKFWTSMKVHIRCIGFCMITNTSCPWLSKYSPNLNMYVSLPPFGYRNLLTIKIFIFYPLYNSIVFSTTSSQLYFSQMKSAASSLYFLTILGLSQACCIFSLKSSTSDF